MYHTVVAILAVILGGAFLYFSFKLLKHFDWFFAWIRGTIGLVFLAFAVFVVIFAFDLSSYRELLSEKTIATLTFEKVEDQKYNVEVDYILDGARETYEISGDQWQMDARIVRWTGIIAALGAKPGYKLDRLSGRYYSLEDERRKKRSVFQVSENTAFIDTWALIQNNSELIPLVDAVYGSATFLPMADNAIFQLSLSHNGLTATPLNDVAEQAVKNWR